MARDESGYPGLGNLTHAQQPPLRVPAPVNQPGLRASHVAGGGVAVALADALVAVLSHYGVHVSDVDALIVGGAAASAGAGLGHVIGAVGLVGAFKRLLRGRSAA